MCCSPFFSYVMFSPSSSIALPSSSGMTAVTLSGPSVL